jgi:hypothetical protein
MRRVVSAIEAETMIRDAAEIGRMINGLVDRLNAAADSCWAYSLTSPEA